MPIAASSTDYLLAIDTSEAIASAALGAYLWSEPKYGLKILASRVSASGSAHEQSLLLCHDVLVDAGVRLSDLSAIIIGNGPGSFTGLRVGYSLAKGLACGLRIPIIECSSFLATAHSAMNAGDLRDLIVASDARRGDLFLGRYSFSLGALVESVPPHIVPLVSLCGELIQDSDLRVIWRTENPPAELKGRQVIVETVPTAVGLLHLALSEAARTAHYNPGEIAACAPAYIRHVAAKTIEERKVVRAT